MSVQQCPIVPFDFHNVNRFQGCTVCSGGDFPLQGRKALQLVESLDDCRAAVSVECEADLHHDRKLDDLGRILKYRNGFFIRRNYEMRFRH
jgi:hypothetical protein